uniref:Uncharacterized protein n=1 Tax=Rhizophora mucronata TaxID=61149 RepID=A0A2P2QCJ4_RHIMU
MSDMNWQVLRWLLNREVILQSQKSPISTNDQVHLPSFIVIRVYSIVLNFLYIGETCNYL